MTPLHAAVYTYAICALFWAVAWLHIIVDGRHSPESYRRARNFALAWPVWPVAAVVWWGTR